MRRAEERREASVVVFFMVKVWFGKLDLGMDCGDDGAGNGEG